MPAPIITSDSDLGKELIKHEQHYTGRISGDWKPGNPYEYRPYPRMVYKAVKKENGKVVCMEPLPQPTFYKDVQSYQIAFAEAERLQQSCMRIVKSSDEERIARGQGWCEDPNTAVLQFEREEQDVAQAAAEAAFRAARMSESARQEFDDAQQGTDAHVVDVVGVKRGRKPRTVAPMAADLEA